MKSQKKQIISFLTIMFITLLCCSLVSATDTTDTTTTTTTHKEVTNTQNVEQTQTNNNIGTTISTQNNIQSDENNIGENDQNEVEDEQNNTKAINKAKMAQTNVKTADSIIQLSSWNQIVNAKSGVFNLTRNIQATSTVTLTGPITIYGNDFTITGTGVNDLFNAGSYAVNLNDLTITGLNGYVINGGTNHHILSSIFDNNGGFWKMDSGSTCYIINSIIENSKNTRTINGWDNKANGVNYYILNSMLRNNPKPTVIQWNNAEFHGFNFFVDNQFITSSTYTTYKGNLNKETDASLSSYTFARQQTGSMDVYAISSPVDITITANDVYINEANKIKIRLNATIGNSQVGYFNVGVPFEQVTLKITLGV